MPQVVVGVEANKVSPEDTLHNIHTLRQDAEDLVRWKWRVEKEGLSRKGLEIRAGELSAAYY